MFGAIFSTSSWPTSFASHGSSFWVTRSFKLKNTKLFQTILSEMDVEPPYKLLTLFTLFSLLTLSTLPTLLFTVFYSVYTVYSVFTVYTDYTVYTVFGN